MERNAWFLQNFGMGAAQEIIFAEFDANNHLKHCIKLNPVIEGQKVYFLGDEFKHCITLVAKYSDIANHRYYAVCNGSQTSYSRCDPRPDITAKPLPESEFSRSIKREG